MSISVNTHKGLFQPKKYSKTLKFETQSVSGIFQRKSEGRLDKINFAKTKSGYILIPGRDDKEHVQNLASVLTFIKSNGFRLKFKNCLSTTPSIIL